MWCPHHRWSFLIEKRHVYWCIKLDRLPHYIREAPLLLCPWRSLLLPRRQMSRMICVVTQSLPPPFTLSVFDWSIPQPGPGWRKVGKTTFRSNTTKKTFIVAVTIRAENSNVATNFSDWKMINPIGPATKGLDRRYPRQYVVTKCLSPLNSRGTCNVITILCHHCYSVISDDRYITLSKLYNDDNGWFKKYVYGERSWSMLNLLFWIFLYCCKSRNTLVGFNFCWYIKTLSKFINL